MRKSIQVAVGSMAAVVLLSLSVAQAASVPTLGVRGDHPSSSGFGQVKPRRVDYGGDPTSFVSDVKWQSWGGKRAVGHGEALWVWPGWCVACGGVELHATVVAFDRTTCQGHTAYAYVEWFFPSRGMSFTRRLLGGENLCTWTFSNPPSKVLNCGSVTLQSGNAVAKDISMLNSPIACSAARQFVAGSGAGRYLGHNARFTVDGWWCGSQLLGSLAGEPQMFSCTRGNFANVNFELKPA